VILGIGVLALLHFFPEKLFSLFPGAEINSSISPTSPVLSDERYKVLYQFAATGILGGALSVFYGLYASIRERKEVIRQLLKDFRGETLAAYNEAKAIRRLFRIKIAHFSQSDGSIHIRDYEELIGKLIDTQLSLEALKRRAVTELQLL